MLPRALKEHFAAAVDRMLRPVVRHLIAQGITYAALTQMLKEIYVDVAESEFALPDKRQTDSRLALITGLNRKEISRLRRLRKPSRPTVAVEDNLVTHVIGRWMAGPPYAAADGPPYRLPYESDNPDLASFARLVRDLSVDIPVRSVLDELLRGKVVTLRLPQGEVELQQEAHIPEDAAVKLTVLGTDPAELFCTIMHNIEHPDAPRLQRKVGYDNIGGDALPEIRAAARRTGEDFVRHANALLAGYDRDQNPDAAGGRRMRVVLGTYYFEEEVPEAKVAPPTPPQPDRRARLPGRIRRYR
jgi:histone H3/H4